jgi:hypothetical protein
MTPAEIVRAVTSNPQRLRVFPVSRPHSAYNSVRDMLILRGWWWERRLKMATLEGELIVYDRTVEG